MPPISLKALIASNLCYWLFLVLGTIVLMIVFYAGLTIASDGTSNSHAIIEQMGASSTLLIFMAFVSIVAASLAGYIGARIAPQAKLLNGALSTLLWYFLEGYSLSKGSSSGSGAHLPFVLHFLTSYCMVIPALAGAYLGKLRGRDGPLHEMMRAAPPMEMPQPYGARRAPGAAPTQSTRRLAYGGSGLGTFIFIASQFLLSQHEQNILFVGLLVVGALIIATALVIKRLKSTG